MRKLRLLALESGISSKSGKAWYKALFRGKTKEGASVTKEFWLSEEVGKSALSQGLKEDMDVYVECGLNDYLSPEIQEIQAVEQSDIRGFEDA